MPWYRAGSVAVTQGSATVTGAGTDFVGNTQAGEAFLGPDGREYEISAVQSATQLTIIPAYQGASAGGQAYAIQPTSSFARDLALGAAQLLNTFGAVRDGIGQGLIPDGTVGTPALRFAADQDTGIRRVSANVMSLVAGGFDRLTIDGNGAFCSGPRFEVRYGSSAAMTFATTAANWSMGVPEGANRWAITENQFGSEKFAILANGDVQVGSAVGGRATPTNLALDSTYFSAVGENQSLKFYLFKSANETYGMGVNSLAGMEYHAGKTAGGDFAWHGFYLNNALRLRINAASLLSGADQTMALGAPATRFATLYAASGTINTSDQREKTWRGALDAAELAAAMEIARSIGVFQFNDARATKGDAEARLHVGVKAQQVVSILEAAGLIPMRYAFVCYDEWEAEPDQPALAAVEDDDGDIVRPAREAVAGRPAGNRYGIRYDELAMFLISAQEQRIAAIEAAL
jgi:hypothetical protein